MQIATLIYDQSKSIKQLVGIKQFNSSKAWNKAKENRRCYHVLWIHIN